VEERIAVVVSAKDDGSTKGAMKAIGSSAEKADQQVSSATKGITKAVAEVGTTAGRAGQKVSAASKGMARDVAGVGAAAGKAEKQVTAANDKIADSTEKTGGVMKTALLAGAAGLGIAVAKFGADAILKTGEVRSQLQAQLGLSAQDAGRYGKLAGDLYAGNYGESVEQVAEALAKVKQATSQLKISSDADLKAITGDVLNVSSVFGEDLNKVINVTGKLLSNGLAPNAKAALDILVTGMQSGANGADDLLDTFEEYPPQFAKLGLDGQAALGLITQGLKAGARNADIVGDAFKEFSIRAIDGSKLTAQGFQTLGLNADVMGQRIAKGGKSASDALDLTLDRLRAIPDPVLRSQTAVALFGTQAEDLGQALFALDPSSAVAGLGQVAGAADRLGAAVGDNPKARIDAFMRSLQVGATNAAGAVLKAFGELPGPLQTAIGVIGGLSGVALTAATGVGVLGPKIKSVRAELDGMGRVGRLANSAVGGIGKGLGAAIPLLGIATAAVSVWNAKKAEEKRAVDDATQALLADNLALGANVRAQITSRLETEGLLKSASTLGINLGTLTDAVYGSAEAQAAIAGAMKTTTTELEANKRANHGVSQADGVRTKALHELRNELPGVIKTEKDAVDAATRQREASEKSAAATKGQTTTAEGAAGAIARQTVATDELGHATRAVTGDATEADGSLKQYATTADLLKAKLDALNGVNLGVTESSIAFKNSLETLRGSVKDNGVALTENSQKGRDNQTAFINATKAAQGLAQAVADKSGYEAGRQSLVTSRGELTKFAHDLGLSDGQVKTLLDSILKLPPIKKTKAEVDAAEAKQRIKDLQTRIDRVHGKNVQISVTQRGVDQVRREISAITGKAVAIQVGKVGQGARGFSKGGDIEGGIPGRDSVPILAMPGERVLTVAENRAYKLRLGGQRAAADSTGAGGTVQLDPADRALLSAVAARLGQPMQVVGELRARGSDLVAVVDRVSTERARR
jgi:phage-related minor tail protein